MDSATEQFVRDQNIKHFKARLEFAEDGPERDMLLKLLAEEEAKCEEPPREGDL